MTTEATFAARSHEENWLPILELAVEEVFGIMLNAKVTPAKGSEHQPNSEFTAMIGLAGSLCGVLTVCCDGKTAHSVAKSMLGDSATSDEEVSDALGEICNMIAGNFKNKLAGTDERCMLSVPTVICGGQYNFHSLAEGTVVETIVLFQDAPVAVRLQLEH
jgi:chemotaxis protein CheX